MPSLVALVSLGAAAYAVFKFGWFLCGQVGFNMLGLSPPTREDVAGQVVWVVGASQGLGESLAEFYGSLGARLVLSSRSTTNLEAARARLTESGASSPNSVCLVPLDILAEPDELRDAVTAAYAAFDAPVDLVLHCVGASQRGRVESTPPAVLEALLRTNLLGPANFAREVLTQQRLHGRGAHCAVLSLAGVMPSPGQAGYAASKSGLRAYLGTMAAELADAGVRVTLVCPGPLGGREGGPARMVHTAEGLKPAADGAHSPGRRLEARAAARMVATAAHHGLDEAWLGAQPLLLFAYLVHYWPRLALRVLRKVGPARARAMEEGRDGYDVRGLVQGEGKGE